jgi:transcriptional regulator with XRE-family HTH domain
VRAYQNRKGACPTLFAQPLSGALAPATIIGVTFRDLLRSEFERRRENNPRYSLRAFARSIGTDHSTLSQILRGRRRLTQRTIARIGASLRLTSGEIAESCTAANDTAVLAAVARPSFRADSRWIATMAGITLDDVNVSLQRLLYHGALIMASPTEWRIA